MLESSFLEDLEGGGRITLRRIVEEHVADERHVELSGTLLFAYRVELSGTSLFAYRVAHLTIFFT